MPSSDTAKCYDDKYKTPNFFQDRRWLYRPFVKALVRKALLAPGSSLLDAGCGQGFFTALFAEHGVAALGVDLSSVGIQVASESYRSLPVRFQVGDILQLPLEEQFDCVFTRSCSLYNSASFPNDTSVTEKLIRHVRPGGVLIFDYYTRLAGNSRATGWLYHSLDEARKHFSGFSGAEVYFSLRLETMLLGGHAFGPRVSRIAALLSRSTGLGGELIAFVRPTRR